MIRRLHNEMHIFNLSEDVKVKGGSREKEGKKKIKII